MGRHPGPGCRRLLGARGPGEPRELHFRRPEKLRRPGRPGPGRLRPDARRLGPCVRRHRERARAAHGARRRGLGRRLVRRRACPLLRRQRWRPERTAAARRGRHHAADARDAARRRPHFGGADPGSGRWPEKRLHRRRAGAERRRQPQYRGDLRRAARRHRRPGAAGGRAGRRHALALFLRGRARLAGRPDDPDGARFGPRDLEISAASVADRGGRQPGRGGGVQDRGAAVGRRLRDGSRAAHQRQDRRTRRVVLAIPARGRRALQRPRHADQRGQRLAARPRRPVLGGTRLDHRGPADLPAQRRHRHRRGGRQVRGPGPPASVRNLWSRRRRAVELRLGDTGVHGHVGRDFSAVVDRQRRLDPVRHREVDKIRARPRDRAGTRRRDQVGALRNRAVQRRAGRRRRRRHGAQVYVQRDSAKPGRRRAGDRRHAVEFSGGALLRRRRRRGVPGFAGGFRRTGRCGQRGRRRIRLWRGGRGARAPQRLGSDLQRSRRRLQAGHRARRRRRPGQPLRVAPEGRGRALLHVARPGAPCRAASGDRAGARGGDAALRRGPRSRVAQARRRRRRRGSGSRRRAGGMQARGLERRSDLVGRPVRSAGARRLDARRARRRVRGADRAHQSKQPVRRQRSRRDRRADRRRARPRRLRHRAQPDQMDWADPDDRDAAAQRQRQPVNAVAVAILL